MAVVKALLRIGITLWFRRVLLRTRIKLKPLVVIFYEPSDSCFRIPSFTTPLRTIHVIHPIHSLFRRIPVVYSHFFFMSVDKVVPGSGRASAVLQSLYAGRDTNILLLAATTVSKTCIRSLSDTLNMNRKNGTYTHRLVAASIPEPVQAFHIWWKGDPLLLVLQRSRRGVFL